MASSEPASSNPWPPLGSDDVEVRVTAEPAQLAIVRTIAGNVAMRQDFDVDAIADMRLAVDEVCSALVQLATAESVLLCRFCPGDSGLGVSVGVCSDDDSGPPTDTFSWRVLTALIDTVDTTVVPRDSSGSDGMVPDLAATDGNHFVRVDLAKRRVAHE